MSNGGTVSVTTVLAAALAPALPRRAGCSTAADRTSADTEARPSTTDVHRHSTVFSRGGDIRRSGCDGHRREHRDRRAATHFTALMALAAVRAHPIRVAISVLPRSRAGSFLVLFVLGASASDCRVMPDPRFTALKTTLGLRIVEAKRLPPSDSAEFRFELNNRASTKVNACLGPSRRVFYEYPRRRGLRSRKCLHLRRSCRLRAGVHHPSGGSNIVERDS